MDARLAPFATTPRLVVKIGSSLLVEGGAIRQTWLASVVADIAACRADGQQVVVVSSGAIALGARRLKLGKGGRGSLDDAQAAAAVGQIALARAWAELFAGHGIEAAQILLTLGDLEDRRRYLNVAATLDRLLALGAVPILNENDSVATQEIRFGDNDRLAARSGQAAGAGAVILLSDIDGLYTANPCEPGATLIPTVARIDDVAHMADGRSASGLGTGGMAAKIAAARIAVQAGMPLAIVDGRRDHPLTAFAKTGHGTVFTAESCTSARKAWLAGRLTVAGRLTIDAGAAAALATGKSLLAAGVVSVDGDFARGDAVEIAHAGSVIARGLTAYDAPDARAIAGARSDAQAAILGYAPRAAMVHRDQLVMV
ncbi:glutamate 5-kinase [Glacieibacterium frigidum]|uniref:Glutamate 5-kinase n=1 Tax=Glacieibacterium frigidum TaxID=2593303 RepID=A0A552UFV8_9SPHN|nr:glutamate 5-kinase [Glacieibacterium frigidum]TRW17094.1 glutamate 5-kinase [Glacieibacterium frigidum]